MSLYTPASLLLDMALFDALKALDHAQLPVTDEQMVMGILRMQAARLTNEASPEVLLKMIAAVGGAKSPDELLESAAVACERSGAHFPH